MLVSKKISTNPSYNTEEAKVGVIQEIRGNSVYWNQLVGQTPSSTYWYAYAGSFSRSVDSNYNFIITPNSSTSGPFQATSSFLTDDDNNKYIYWRVNGYVNRETTIQIRFGTITQKTITVNGNFTVSGIRPPKSSNNYRYFIIRAFHGETPSGSDTLIIRPGTILVDLTKMYWWSNTIPTVSEFENQFLTESSYPKSAGGILSTKYDSIGVYADNSLTSEISLNITDSLSSGLRSAKNAYDSAIIENGYLTGFIKRISGANLGDFSWEYLEESETFKASFPSLKIPDSGEPNVICGKYQVVSKEYQDANDTGEYTDTTVAIDVVDNQAYIYIKGTNYTTVSDFTSSAIVGYAIWYETEPEEILLQTPVSLSYNCGDYEQTATGSDRSAPLFVTINYSTDIINKIRFNDETHFVQDWRISGIDAEPIGGSINLVTSNGIYQEINNLNNNKEDVSNKTDELNSFSSSDEYPSASAVVNYVNTKLTSVLKYKGTIGSSGATISSLPATHSVGDVYVVKTAGTYAGKACEIGDYIICNTAGTSANNAHWDVVNGENQVENKSASLAAAGSSATIATIDGTDITVTTPSGWTGLDKVGTITKVGTTSSGDVTVSSSNNTASFGSSVTVGTVGGVDLKFTMPSNPDTDTKNTAGSTDTSSKIYLIGATSQDANPQTYSDNEVYATSGVLTTKSVQVGGTAATMQYNSTDNSIEFIFT